ncbi:hypothetical protein BTO28_01480 [Domibacillus epiphyticus]|uniref:Uncharacterized protein n=1 Tax=Domibacillus epiphyticus TaxID=1714355 RepID=A0A1V2ACM3_9BACI|nr:hypothetical protein BTO28_01480 [Domibacillus epiphyticus]
MLHVPFVQAAALKSTLSLFYQNLLFLFGIREVVNKGLKEGNAKALQLSAFCAKFKKLLYISGIYEIKTITVYTESFHWISAV